MSPVKNELGFYIPEDDILHSHRRGYLTSYMLQKPDSISVFWYRDNSVSLNRHSWAHSSLTLGDTDHSTQDKQSRTRICDLGPTLKRHRPQATFAIATVRLAHIQRG
jgi:hypothetical protein